jgi:hypothetical protein
MREGPALQDFVQLLLNLNDYSGAEMADTGQPAAQAPHSTHFSGSIS